MVAAAAAGHLRVPALVRVTAVLVPVPAADADVIFCKACSDK